MTKINYRHQTLVINSRGGGIAEYYVENDGTRHDIIYGYKNEEDADGSMGEVLSPFPGRVDNSEYDFMGNHYKLSGFFEKNGNTLHGFVRELPWKVEKTADHQITSIVDVKGEEFSAKGYPFDLKYQIIYDLEDGGLRVKTKVTNCGEKAAPFGLGFHPYFKVAVEVDEMVWRVPAKKLVEFDERLKPTGRLLNVGETRLDFRTAKAIKGIEIDNCFTELIRDEKGIFTSTLSNLTDTKRIKIWQDENFPFFQTYSADTISDKNYRKAMALEPQTCCGYAVNIPNLGLISLQPGEEFRGEWGVQYIFKI